jgi:hypothetical protein
MPKLSVDFGNEDTNQDFEPIDPGKYECQVDEVEIRDSAAGNQYLAWRFRIIDDGPFKNRILFHNTSLVEKALWNLKGLLKNLGVNVSQGVNALDTDSLVGKRIICTVSQEEYNGKMTENVVATAPSPNANKPIDLPDVEEVSGNTNAESNKAESNKAEDDIPF